MKLKNLTPEVQVVRFEELSCEHREYDIYLEPNGTTEVEGLIPVNLEDLSGSVEVVNPTEVLKDSVMSSDTLAGDTSNIEDDITEESTPEKVDEKVSDEFVCDVCGAEFASARGLTTHKNKSHQE